MLNRKMRTQWAPLLVPNVAWDSHSNPAGVSVFCEIPAHASGKNSTVLFLVCSTTAVIGHREMLSDDAS